MNYLTPKQETYFGFDMTVLTLPAGDSLKKPLHKKTIIRYDHILPTCHCLVVSHIHFGLVQLFCKPRRETASLPLTSTANSCFGSEYSMTKVFLILKVHTFTFRCPNCICFQNILRIMFSKFSKKKQI